MGCNKKSCFLPMYPPVGGCFFWLVKINCVKKIQYWDQDKVLVSAGTASVDIKPVYVLVCSLPRISEISVKWTYVRTVAVAGIHSVVVVSYFNQFIVVFRWQPVPGNTR